ncbi:hypothetical protein MRX96_006129 [Rhipicephalus microplus]
MVPRQGRGRGACLSGSTATTLFVGVLPGGGASPTPQFLKSLKRLFPDEEKMAFRTKTVAGVSALMFGDMEELLRPSNICHAALKEEAQNPGHNIDPNALVC